MIHLQKKKPIQLSFTLFNGDIRPRPELGRFSFMDGFGKLVEKQKQSLFLLFFIQA
jgi:hypothetical protein